MNKEQYQVCKKADKQWKNSLEFKKKKMKLGSVVHKIEGNIYPVYSVILPCFNHPDKDTKEALIMKKLVQNKKNKVWAKQRKVLRNMQGNV